MNRLMKMIKNPDKALWPGLCQRPAQMLEDLSALVNSVFEEVKNKGDEALRKYSLQFDQIENAGITVSAEKIKAAESQISAELKAAIALAKNNIEAYHKSQLAEGKIVENTPGVRCWQESRAIQSVGLYIPGGTAPLFSTLLMLGIPALIAGCRNIAICSPPNKQGEIAPEVLYVAQLLGIEKVYSLGGIQAIAAFCFGTETIVKVDKVFGPGNQYVTAAKLAAQNNGLTIDMPAGPSEVLVIADESANPEFVAADLLSQAEHGIDSQVMLLCTNENLIESILQEIEKQVELLARKDIAIKALEKSCAVLLSSLGECFEFSNCYAPEHLILALAQPRLYTSLINSAGSVFLGHYSCESLGDYASGTNHTLPTNGYARSYSGLNMDSFMKKISFQEISIQGIQNIGPAVELMAEAEQLFAHKNAVTVRLKYLNQ